jgi:hypothetical protein
MTSGTYMPIGKTSFFPKHTLENVETKNSQKTLKNFNTSPDLGILFLLFFNIQRFFT